MSDEHKHSVIALKRSGAELFVGDLNVLDASKIRVEIVGSKAILHGTVRTLAQREEAERIAWAAQGVCSVEDHLAVKWYPSGD